MAFIVKYKVFFRLKFNIFLRSIEDWKFWPGLTLQILRGFRTPYIDPGGGVFVTLKTPLVKRTFYFMCMEWKCTLKSQLRACTRDHAIIYTVRRIKTPFISDAFYLAQTVFPIRINFYHLLLFRAAFPFQEFWLLIVCGKAVSATHNHSTLNW